MKKITHDILKSARELISKGWTKDAYALAADFIPTSPKKENAVYFCTIGAIRRCSNDTGEIICAKNELRKFIPDNFNYSIADWNDSCSGPEEVLAVFDKALAQPIEDE